ncbi:WD40 repeat-like protein [Coprinellus micaceus]|uniref:WD40 repeat-like protein n=1 Tax=Coprinellus micaceus TaxID=71717 RepID=A0A4Y7TF10_COPMI|nr:WD40 repeat-like protein [Coprinellus micaceus]
MRFRTLEIRWHDSKPISTCDFQPVSFKKARPPAGQEQNYAGQSYRLATGGEDNHIRIWMVHPNILPASLVESSSAPNGPRAPRVEYLATLSRHSAAVNVVRWSPNGDVIASAGDDGMIIIWAPSSSPQPSTYGSDLSPEDLLHEKEYWKPRITFRCSQMQVYDLAWSPTGEYVIAGSTDNTARVFSVLDGKCVWEIAEHSHYVQGVAWDPLNEYVATQSSDRSMHIYRISLKNGAFEAHAIGKNTRMPHRHSRTPSAHGHASSSRPRLFHRESTSDIESGITDDPPSTSGHTSETTPLTPAMSSVSGTSSAMFPPPIEASSRRSSFSGSNAPGSPSTFSRYGRSPSPMPPLPAIRSLPPNSWSSVKLYGDESFTNFFRRLTFSPDGGLLLTPAGQFEDPSHISVTSKSDRSDTPARGRKGRPSVSYDGSSGAGLSSSSSSSVSSVFIYSRANFARPPIAQLPGYKKASVAVRFSPILYELRPNVEGARDPETKTAALEKGVDGAMDVDIVGPTSTHTAIFENQSSGLLATPQRTPQVLPTNVAAPVPKLAISTNANNTGSVSKPSPALSPMDMRPPTPAASKPPTPAPSSTPQHHNHHHQHSQSPQTGSIFALPYRMLYSVITKDTVCIYDTQQAGPVCLLTKLHYDEFTDMTWSPDGQTLILSSRDGYCTIVIFDEILAAHHTQQHALQMQSIAHHHSVPLLAPSTSTSSTTPHHNHTHSHSHSVASANVTPAATPASANIGLPPFSVTPQVPKKRTEPPLTPAASVDGSDSASYFAAPSSVPASGTTATATSASASTSGATDGENSAKSDAQQEPPKKKRRVALTRVGDLPQ